MAINVNGISIQDILSGDWDGYNKLGDEDLRKLTSRLVSASNKRIVRLQKAKLQNVSSAFIKRTREKNVKFSVKNKTRNEVLHEFRKAKEFLRSKTSTVSGARAFKKATEKRLGGGFYTKAGKPSERLEKSFWNGYRRFMEENAGLAEAVFGQDYSERVQEFLHREFIEKGERNWNSIFDHVRDLFEEYYQEVETQQSEFEEDILDEFDY